MNIFQKLELGFSITLIVIISFGWFLFPAILKSQIKSQSALKKGGEVREMWEKLPFPLEFKIFLFNVTNYKEVHKGATPILQEVGPYYYEEWLEKTEIEDDEETDSVSYYIKRTYHFKPEKSGGLTGHEIVVIPHPLIMVAAFTILRTPQAYLISTFGKVVDILFQKPETGFLIAEAGKILFDGLPIYCNVTDVKAKSVCKKLKKEAKDLGRFSEDVLKLSLFHSKNGTHYGRYKSKRGIKNGKDLGKVIEYDGNNKMDIWSGDKCNEIYGTDATIFPTLLNSDEYISTFSPEICRTTNAYFQRKLTYKGISVNRYTATLGDMSNNENEKCFCSEKCLKKGAMDLMKCINNSLVITLPHFYDTDESYLNEVKGLQPDQNKHEIFLNFEHMSGLPLLSAKRLQFNLPIESVEKMPLLKNLPTCLLPMFWIEESLEMNATYINRLKNELFFPMKIIAALKWTISIVSTFGLIAAIFFHFKGFKQSSNKYIIEKYKSRSLDSFTTNN